MIIDHLPARTYKMHNKGFTLIELMVIIAIVSIILAIAIPSLTGFATATRVSAQANEFIASVSFARSEAVKRNGTVSLCPSSDGASCASSTKNWSAGWIVSLADGTVLRVYTGSTGGATLTASTAGALTFNPNGQLSSAINFDLCGGTNSRSIRISQIGRVESINPSSGC